MGRTPPGELSLPRREGIRRAAEFQTLFQQGNRDERASFLALWRAGAAGRRVAFATSRRLGGAVKRNRARRRLREAYRREQRALGSGVEAIFVARSAVATRPFPALLAEMRQALRSMKQARQAMTGGIERE